MKKIFILLFLIFGLQQITHADDIRDFQIEGVSIGDSMLKFFSEKELIDGIRKDSYKNSDKKFIDINLKAEWFEQYEGIQVTIKRNDKKYIAQSVDGGIFFDREKKPCINKMEKIINEMSNLFKETVFEPQEENTHYADPSGKSKVFGSSVFLDNGTISVYCYLWDDAMNYVNYVAVSTKTNEFNEWLTNLQ